MQSKSEPLSIAQLGEPVLRQVASSVLRFNCADLDAFIEQLLAKMLESNGVGIAAPQVHVSKQIMIIASRPNARYPDAPEMTPLVMINPQIIKSGHPEIIEKDWEGCLSIPGIRAKVPRATNVKVVFMDRYGAELQREFTGFLARIFLHEYDHLIGLSYLDRVEDNKDIVSETYYLTHIVKKP
ncbi:peptide deformylase [Flocculibacter collagenilyticus]|uniref:peptide deformylase n=1 Tax=Flocculibacter collagenilyticus TaxID=2744479 RepID=UPI0018F6256B|nr:peptide deformylase [Flocculibacter collagenilyticus]